MTLSELSAQYRAGGDACKIKIMEMEAELKTKSMGETERYRLRRKLYMVSIMMREQIAMSRYLENYYGGDNDGKKYVC